LPVTSAIQEAEARDREFKANLGKVSKALFQTWNKNKKGWDV
jgi:hypothetical protein